MSQPESPVQGLLPPRRFGTREGFNSFIGPFLVYGFIAFLLVWVTWPEWYQVKNGVILMLGAFALWRYGWLILNYIRALIYNRVVYPRLQREAQALPLETRYPKRVYFMIPSFKEEPWISLETIRSVMNSIADIPSAATIIVATGADLDDAIISEAFTSHPAHSRAELILQRQGQGKRIAMGHALRAVARRFDDDDQSVTIFMDGDSRIEANALRQLLPLFCANPRLGAVTTNEIAYLMDKNSATRQWFELKMGQRHVLFQSHSLSRRVLTLTGRFSLIRTKIVTTEKFIQQIENDHLIHWMHGRFRFLMGDDKSTWYQLLKDGWEMLYAPDVVCYSLESRVTPFSELSLSLPYRWYGNTLRNNSRALALGPKAGGWFIWMAILDQRLSMWTALVGITGSLMLAIYVSYIYLPFYLAWALFVRTIQLAIIALSGHRVGMLTVPLMMYNQWVGAFVKMHAFFHLSRQRWFKGAQQSQAQGKKAQRAPGSIDSPLAEFMPNFHMGISLVAFVFTLLVSHHLLRLPNPRLLEREATIYEAEAILRGVWPDDGADDALALQSILDSLPHDKPSVVTLPAGQLDFFRPVVLSRSNVTIQGAGNRQTVISSHLTQPAGAVIKVAGFRGRRIGALALSLPRGENGLKLTALEAEIRPGDLLQLTAPNDRLFLDELGSTVWREQEPALRQFIAVVTEAQETRLTLDQDLLSKFPVGSTEAYRVQAVTNVVLRDFTITQAPPGPDAMPVSTEFENSHPSIAVDGLVLEWTSGVRVEDVRFNNAGRNPLVIRHSHGYRIENCWLDGAWNKGEGSGNLVITGSHGGELRDLKLRNLRQIIFQWSSSRNRVENLVSTVGVRFDGGHVQHNRVEDAEFHLPVEYPWPKVSRASEDSPELPPEGPANEVREKPAKKGAPKQAVPMVKL